MRSALSTHCVLAGVQRVHLHIRMDALVDAFLGVAVVRDCPYASTSLTRPLPFKRRLGSAYLKSISHRVRGAVPTCLDLTCRVTVS